MTDERSTSPFLDTVREAIRVRHYSIRAEDAYVWNLETTVDRFVWLASIRFSTRTRTNWRLTGLVRALRPPGHAPRGVWLRYSSLR